MRIFFPTLALLALFCPLSLQAASPDPKSPTLMDEENKTAKPSALPTKIPEANKALAAVANPESSPSALPKLPSVLDKNLIVAFYGNPQSTRMGILGEQPIDDTAKLLKKTAEDWAGLLKNRNVLTAFHLIYATVNADASVGVLSDKTIQTYIDYATENGMIVILDHQIGKLSIETCMNSLLPWLQYPNVHLALDPEWKTLTPGVTLGSMTGEEVNKAEQMMEDYMKAHDINERRMLVIHQFNYKTLLHRDVVRADFDRVDLVHHADGFGVPAVKLGTYQFLSTIKNIPIKGFKLFFPKPWKRKGFDDPMLTPEEVLALKPQPLYISYQ